MFLCARRKRQKVRAAEASRANLPIANPFPSASKRTGQGFSSFSLIKRQPRDTSHRDGLSPRKCMTVHDGCGTAECNAALMSLQRGRQDRGLINGGHRAAVEGPIGCRAVPAVVAATLTRSRICRSRPAAMNRPPTRPGVCEQPIDCDSSEAFGSHPTNRAPWRSAPFEELDRKLTSDDAIRKYVSRFVFNRARPLPSEAVDQAFQVRKCIGFLWLHEISAASILLGLVERGQGRVYRERPVWPPYVAVFHGSRSSTRLIL